MKLLKLSLLTLTASFVLSALPNGSTKDAPYPECYPCDVPPPAR